MILVMVFVNLFASLHILNTWQSKHTNIKIVAGNKL